MAIGRISGSVLKSNLTRNGVDLAFETNLLYLDVTNSRVGIGTSEPSTALHVVGNTTISDTLTANSIVTNNISSADSSAVQVNDALNVSGTVTTNTLHTQSLTVTDINSDDSTTIQVDGSWQVSGFYYGDGRYLTGLAPALQQYQFANTASDISTYYVAKDLADYTQGTLGTATVTVGTSGTLLASFATQTGYPNITVIPSGKVQILFETQKASGNKFYICYAEVHKRNTSGTETLLFTTDVSSPITANTLVQQDVSYFVGAPITLSLTDRIVIKIYAYTASSTDNITLTWDSTTASSLLLPTTPASATNFVPYLNATADVNLGSYGLKAATVTTNAISSDDSTAVQINDAVNVSGSLTAGTSVEVGGGGGFGTVTTTQFASIFAKAIGSNATSLVQVKGNDGTTGMGMRAVTGSTSLIYSNGQIDFRVGSTIRDLDVPSGGTTIASIASTGLTVTGITVTGTLTAPTFVTNDISSADSSAIQINDSVNISGALSSSGIKYPTSDGTNGQFIKTDGAGNLTFGTVSTNSISQLNSNVTVTDAGTGSITIVADGTTVATFDTATGVDASTSTKSLRLPNGATGDRPTGAAGMVRYNSTTDTIEGYTTAGGWAQLGATTAAAQDTTNTSVNAYTAISTTQVTADSFLTGAFDSAWYLAVSKDEINTEMSTAKYSLVQNKTSAYVSTSSLTSSGTNKQIAIDADVSGGNVRLRATGTSVVNSVSFYRIGLGDNTTAATSGNASTIINATVTSSSSNIDTWSKLSYRGAKYFISAKNSTTGEYSNMECMITHYNNTPYIQVYNNVNTGNNDLLTLDASISGNNVQLTASANQPNCRVILYRILLSDAETAAAGTNTNVIGATTVSSSDTTVDSFLTSSYTGCHYVVVAVNSTEGTASIQEVTVVSDGADAYVTTGPIVSSKSSDQLQFSASLSGTTATLKASSTSGSSTTINAYRVQLYRPSAGASTADTVLVSTTQTISGQKTFTAPIALTVGSDPSTVANTAHIYAKSAASSAEVYVRDEAGNVTKISPHNEQGEWEYYSHNTKTGKTVRINMEEMIRDIEKITGKNYIKTTN